MWSQLELHFSCLFWGCPGRSPSGDLDLKIFVFWFATSTQCIQEIWQWDETLVAQVQLSRWWDLRGVKIAPSATGGCVWNQWGSTPTFRSITMRIEIRKEFYVTPFRDDRIVESSTIPRTRQICCTSYCSSVLFFGTSSPSLFIHHDKTMQTRSWKLLHSWPDITVASPKKPERHLPRIPQKVRYRKSFPFVRWSLLYILIELLPQMSIWIRGVMVVWSWSVIKGCFLEDRTSTLVQCVALRVQLLRTLRCSGPCTQMFGIDRLVFTRPRIWLLT